MPFRRHSFARRPVASRRRKFEWARTNYASAGAVASDSIDLLAGFRARIGGITQNLPDWTLVRLRGTMNFNAVQVEDVQTTLVVIGAIKWSTSNVGLPLPVALPHEDWIMYSTVGNPGATTATGAATVAFSLTFDVKSMRKLNQIDDTIWLCWAGVNGAKTYTAAGVISAGFKLP